MVSTKVPERDSGSRRPASKVLSALVATAVAGVAGLAVLRWVVSGVFGHDGNSYTAALLALTPFGVPVAAGLALVAWALRRRGVALLSVVLAGVLVAPLVPRVLADAQPEADGPVVRVAALNLYFGQAAPDAVVEFVREHRVDVLTLLELDEQAQSALEDAGLRESLPHVVAYPAGAGVGSGIASRYPLEEVDLAGPSLFAQPGVRTRLPGGTAVEVVAVHALPPVTDAAQWRSDLAGLPPASSAGFARILAGDFNATLDHAAFRHILDAGYVDAAESTGNALVTTWPRRRLGPPVTLDHVLVENGAAVLDFAALDVEGSDHRAVLATLRLPKRPG
ncbi:endonuclease/exonuclease/phosphatase family protein [Saccharomonospora xinjiangensis]|uniref:Endonuclease/exonuclease/phosphatase domain-containing protein n=1 Tax=Saccharomonospora xinjiangensis XJ-54 TaxID=882086 RepID=I0V3R7_9PSEU|nr:hypothetical protein SacxiDRAFT_2548 [Saccharomonospora xinjiangensis XJ-54]